MSQTLARLFGIAGRSSVQRSCATGLLVTLFITVLLSCVFLTLFWDELFGKSSASNTPFVSINIHNWLDTDDSISKIDSVFISASQNRENAQLDENHVDKRSANAIIDSNAPVVVVGFCCDFANVAAKCEAQHFVTALAQGTFPRHRIVYSQCTQRGLAPFWTANFSSDNATEMAAHSGLQPATVWLLPDIYLCQGFFYDATVVDTRRKVDKSQLIEVTAAMREQMDAVEFRHKHTRHLVKHFKGRPFLTTHNTEPWGGGGCGDRYDVIMESNWDRTSNGCVSFHIPPSFFFEFQRALNHTSELIRSPQRLRQPLSAEVDAVVRSKVEFALFLVRDCFIRYYRQDTLVRVVFFMLLSQRYKEVTSLGGCKRNVEKHVSLGLDYCPKNAKHGWFMGKKYNCKGFGYTDGVVQMLKPYKFYLAMENSMRLGYSTEKVMNAFYGNAVPVYFGDDRLTQYINPKAYIHCRIGDAQLAELLALNRTQEYEHLEAAARSVVQSPLNECVQRVKEVDSNDSLYRQMLAEPVFRSDNTWKNSLLDPAYAGLRLRNMLRLHQSYLIDDHLYSDDNWRLIQHS